MWITIKSELKNLTNSKWKIFTLFLMLITPLIYGFVLLSAFWQPIHNINNLQVFIVNKDTSDKGNFNSISKTLARNLSGVKHNLGLGEKDPSTGKTKYSINIKSIYDPQNKINVEKIVNDDQWNASFVINNGFSEKVIDAGVVGFDNLLVKNNGWEKLLQDINNPSKFFNYVISNLDIKMPTIDFYNSFKNNYIIGELTNMGSQLSSVKLQMLAAINFGNLIDQSVIRIKTQFPKIPATDLDRVANLLKTFFNDNNTANPEKTKQIFEDFFSNMIQHKSIGKEISSYGRGLSPYIISMSIWAGTLFMALYYKNHRVGNQNRCGTFSNYFGKTVIWLVTGWIQTSLLLGSIFILGLRMDNGFIGQVAFFIFALFISTIFSLVVQALAFSFRFGELGGFIVLILLILQLASSSGTFPSELQNPFFAGIHPYIPFTYSIEGFREFMYKPTWTIIFEKQWKLLIFLVIVPISLTINWLYDKRTYSKFEQKYKSFEINFGDE